MTVLRVCYRQGIRFDEKYFCICEMVEHARLG
jgi:hypothetical protein